PARTFDSLQGAFPPGAINSPVDRASPTASGCGTAKAPRASGRPPAGLCPPNAERGARAWRPAVEASRGPERLARRSRGGRARAARRLRVSRVRGALGGPGPRAPRARCVPRPARKARRAGAARLRAAFSPPPPAPRGFGRQGAGAGGAGVRGPPAGGNGVDRCPGAARWTEAELRPARRLFVLAAGSAGPGGKSYWASGASGLWEAGGVRPSRCAVTSGRPAATKSSGGRCAARTLVRSGLPETCAQGLPGSCRGAAGPPDLKEKKEVVEEAENGRDAPANGNANEENGEQEADNEVDEEEEEGGEEEEEEEEGDGEEEDGDEDEEAEAATGKRAAEDDEDDDVDTKKQKTDEDD
uniref:Prothymosin alpha n=1 Tax=Canis lupus familiaris TaxID=9615 RepID=A0A8I3PVL2_CANLF